MWASAQRDGRHAEYRWRHVLNAVKFGSRPLLKCRAVTLPIGQRKTWRTQNEFCTTSAGNGQTSSIGWLASVERRRCSNEAKTRKLLKLAAVPQTTGLMSATSAPKFTIL